MSNIELNELKPVRCGCGGEATTSNRNKGEIIGCWEVECSVCGICVEGYETEAEAITAWNRAMGAKNINVPTKERTAKVEEVEKPNVFKCSECGQFMHRTSWSRPVKYCNSCGCRLIWGDDDE